MQKIIFFHVPSESVWTDMVTSMFPQRVSELTSDMVTSMFPQSVWTDMVTSMFPQRQCLNWHGSLFPQSVWTDMVTAMFPQRVSGLTWLLPCSLRECLNWHGYFHVPSQTMSELTHMLCSFPAQPPLPENWSINHCWAQGQVCRQTSTRETSWQKQGTVWSCCLAWCQRLAWWCWCLAWWCWCLVGLVLMYTVTHRESSLKSQCTIWIILCSRTTKKLGHKPLYTAWIIVCLCRWREARSQIHCALHGSLS